MNVPPPPYSPLVRELFASLPGSGALPEGPGELLAGEAGSPAAGAWVRFAVRLEGEVIRAARFAAWGCPHTLAAAAWVTGRLPGQPLAAAPGLAVPRELAAALGAPAAKLGRLLAVEEAIRALVGARDSVRKS